MSELFMSVIELSTLWELLRMKKCKNNIPSDWRILSSRASVPYTGCRFAVEHLSSKYGENFGTTLRLLSEDNILSMEKDSTFFSSIFKVLYQCIKMFINVIMCPDIALFLKEYLVSTFYILSALLSNVLIFSLKIKTIRCFFISNR